MASGLLNLRFYIAALFVHSLQTGALGEEAPDSLPLGDQIRLDRLVTYERDIAKKAEAEMAKIRGKRDQAIASKRAETITYFEERLKAATKAGDLELALLYRKEIERLREGKSDAGTAMGDFPAGTVWSWETKRGYDSPSGMILFSRDKREFIAPWSQKPIGFVLDGRESIRAGDLIIEFSSTRDKFVVRKDALGSRDMAIGRLECAPNYSADYGDIMERITGTRWSWGSSYEFKKTSFNIKFGDDGQALASNRLGNHSPITMIPGGVHVYDCDLFFDFERGTIIGFRPDGFHCGKLLDDSTR